MLGVTNGEFGAPSVKASGGGGSSGAVTQIAQVIASSNISSVTFTAIPQTYTNLRVVGQARTLNAGASDQYITTLNGGAANADMAYYGANSGTGAVGRTTNNALGFFVQGEADLVGGGGTAGVASFYEMEIPLYAKTTFMKTVMIQTGYCDPAASQENFTLNGTSRAATAVSSITITASSGSAFVTGTGFTLYGEQ